MYWYFKAILKVLAKFDRGQLKLVVSKILVDLVKRCFIGIIPDYHCILSRAIALIRVNSSEFKVNCRLL